jgi:PRD1 phage membrane DNA delivery
MSDNLSTGIVSVLLAIIGVATLAAILSPRSTTANVITAGGNAIGSDLTAALSPITGGSWSAQSLSTSSIV